MLAKKIQEELYEKMEEEQEDSEESLDMENDSTDSDESVVENKGSKKELQIEDLPSVGAATAEKLRLGGFDTIMAIAVATPGELVNAAGMTESAARKLIQASRGSIDMGFES